MQTIRRATIVWQWVLVVWIACGLAACTPAGATNGTTAQPAATVQPVTTTEPATSPATESMPTATTGTGSTSQAATYADPFSYCAAVGTIDVPDGRYTGPAVPDAIAQGVKNASGASADAPLDIFKQGTSWRCMDGKVYACFVGANLPCDSKANTDKTPTSAETDYCKSNPNSDFIPAAVTGHDTIYAWRCNQETPAIDKQVFHVDSQGYIQEIWYQLAPQ
jgi:hypothetical protein